MSRMARQERLPTRRPLRRILPLIALLCLASASGAALAQTKAPDITPPPAAKNAPKANPAPAAPKAAPKDSAQQPSPQAAVPDNAKLAILIQNTLIAVNHANLTGNYSVLRDLATPGFQSMNSAAQLAENFADLRKRGIDLSPIVLFQPKLVRQAAVDEKGFLRVVGFHDTRPEQVQFELIFALVSNQWRLHGLGVRTVPAPPAPAAEAPPGDDKKGNKTAPAR